MHSSYKNPCRDATRMHMQLKFESHGEVLYHSAFCMHDLPQIQSNTALAYTHAALEHVHTECAVNIPQRMILQAQNILLKPTTLCEDTELKTVDDMLRIQCSSTYTDIMSSLAVGHAVVQTPSTVFVTKVPALHVQLLDNDMKLSVFALLPPATHTDATYIENYVQEKTNGKTYVHDVTNLNQVLNRRTHNYMTMPQFSSHRLRRQQLKKTHANMMRNFVPVPTHLPSTLVLHSGFSACSTQLAGADHITFHTLLFS